MRAFLISLLALAASTAWAAPVEPNYPEIVLIKDATAATTGTFKPTQPVAYQISAWGTGATVSATVKVYCKSSNLGFDTKTQQGSDITLSGSVTDTDSSVTVTAACPFISADVTAVSSTTVNVVARPVSGTAAGASSTAPIYTTTTVAEGAATATAADIDQVGAKTILTVDVGGASRLMCIFQNTDVAANTTLDEFNIYAAPAGYTATSMPVMYTEADFASPSGALLAVRTGAGGDTTDATPDTTLDESDYLTIWMDVGGMDSVTFQASAAADNAAIDARCSYN